jgi:hypothetical protein
MRRKEWGRYIKACMAKGKECDRMSSTNDGLAAASDAGYVAVPVYFFCI